MSPECKGSDAGNSDMPGSPTVFPLREKAEVLKVTRLSTISHHHKEDGECNTVRSFEREKPPCIYVTVPDL